MVGRKIVCARPFAQRCLDALQLASVHKRLPAGAWSSVQCFETGMLPLPVPTGDAHPAHLEPTADIGLGDVPFSKQPSRQFASFFQ